MAVDLNTSVPHSARIYDHLLGGRDNFEADRSAAAEIVKASPSIPISMRANRRYMARVARYLAHERGIRQFLDIGAGLPTAPNLHEVVQGVDPASRIVYVDNDPIVLRQARPLLASTAQGSITYLEADLRETTEILSSPEVRDGIDPTRPVAISMIAVLQFVPGESEAHKIIDALLDPFPPGSALAISTVTAHNEQAVAGAAVYRSRGIPAVARTDDEVTALFRGLELVDPGVTLVSRWRPGPEDAEVEDYHVQMSGGVAIKQ